RRRRSDRAPPPGATGRGCAFARCQPRHESSYDLRKRERVRLTSTRVYLQRRKRRNVLERVAPAEGTALEQPQLSVREAVLDVPRARPAGGCWRRREGVEPSVALTNDLAGLTSGQGSAT